MAGPAQPKRSAGQPAAKLRKSNTTSVTKAAKAAKGRSGPRSSRESALLPSAALERAIVRRGKSPVLDEAAATKTDLENRERIVEAGHRVFSRDGFHGARIVDIAAEARLGIGTVYRHFGAKADIFEAVIRGVIDEIYVGGSFLMAPGPEPLKRISAANENFLRLYHRSHGLMATLNHLATQDELFKQIYLEQRRRATERLEHAIERLQESGLANKALAPSLAAEALIAMMADVAFAMFTIAGAAPEDIDLDTINEVWAGALGLVDEAAAPSRKHRSTRSTRRSPKP
jgi:AcrR family transcriptional regulator